MSRTATQTVRTAIGVYYNAIVKGRKKGRCHCTFFRSLCSRSLEIYSSSFQCVFVLFEPDNPFRTLETQCFSSLRMWPWLLSAKARTRTWQLGRCAKGTEIQDACCAARIHHPVMPVMLFRIFTLGCRSSRNKWPSLTSARHQACLKQQGK